MENQGTDDPKMKAQADSGSKEKATSGTETKGSGDAATAEAATPPTIEERLKKVENDLKEKHNSYLYLLAEFENYKKQMAKERKEVMNYASERAIVDLLPAVDNLSLALDFAKQARDSKAIVDGLEMTYKQLLGIFEGMGCQFLSSVGEAFDPTKHEAMMHKESPDVDPDTVLQEYQKGCLLNGRLIRPARVVVSKKAEEKTN